MNTNYRVTNFKAFPDSGGLTLRPITLIYGPNSSGKSSLLQSLLLLKQTLQESENPSNLLLSKGHLVDLGNYREFVFCHDLNNHYSFQFTIPIAVEHLSRGRRRGYNPFADYGVTHLGVRVVFRTKPGRSNPEIAEYQLFEGESEEPIATFEQLVGLAAERHLRLARRRSMRRSTLLRGKSINPKHEFWSRYFEKVTSEFERVSLPRLTRTLERQRTRLAGYESADVLAGSHPRGDEAALMRRRIASLEATIARNTGPLDDRLKHIENLHKETVVSCKNFLPVDVGHLEADDTISFGSLEWEGQPFGRPLIAEMLIETSQRVRDFLENTVYLGPLRQYPLRHYIFGGNVVGDVGKAGSEVGDILFKDRNLLRRVNEQLQRFDIGYELLVSGSKNADVFSMLLKDKVTGIKASILDVGFGISQVLPVVVQSMLSRDNTICVEQPEIHLHPRLQAELGSLLVDSIRDPYRNRFIVETHSQHLMLRLQRLIRTKQLNSDEVSVFYVDRTSSGSHCIELRLDAEGDFIDRWPGGFFEEGYNEVFG